MQTRLIELHHQRGRLVERIASQRRALTQQLVPLQKTFNVTDRVSRLVQSGKALMQRYPLWVVAAVAAVVLLKPRTLWRWTQRSLLAWRTWRSISRLLPAFLVDQFRSLLR